MGNWQREIERFAPGTPVRRFHGAARSLDGLADGEFVLTTYGTMRLDARAARRACRWGMVVADEAQHVKNPYSATARQLRTIGATRARRAHRHPGGEQPLRAVGDPRLDHARAAGPARHLPHALRPGRRGRQRPGRRRAARPRWSGRSCCAAASPTRASRPSCRPRPRPTGPCRSPRNRPGCTRRWCARPWPRSPSADGMARRGLVVKLLTGAEADLQPPGAVPQGGRGRGSPGRSGKLELLDELLDTILAEGASVLVFTQYVQMARLLERHLAARGVPHAVPARRHAGRRARGDGASASRTAKCPVFLLSLKAAGTGPEPHPRRACRALRPLVEPGRRGAGHRPRVPHRPDPARAGAPADRRGHHRGPHRRRCWQRKRELADAVLGSGEAGADRTDRRRTGRPGGAARERDDDAAQTSGITDARSRRRAHLRRAAARARPRLRPDLVGPGLAEGAGGHGAGRRAAEDGAAGSRARARSARCRCVPGGSPPSSGTGTAPRTAPTCCCRS